MTVALVCLIGGILCAIIARVMLLTAAFRISVYWGLGLFLPFGPLCFRLCYPEEAASSRMFRLATLVCFFSFLALGGLGPIPYGKKQPPAKSNDPPLSYSLEQPVPASLVSSPRPTPKITVETRRAANARELEQLRAWGEQLRLRKQDLRRNDREGNRAYAMDLALYDDAMTRATAEKNALAADSEK